METMEQDTAQSATKNPDQDQFAAGKARLENARHFSRNLALHLAPPRADGTDEMVARIQASTVVPGLLAAVTAGLQTVEQLQQVHETMSAASPVEKSDFQQGLAAGLKAAAVELRQAMYTALAESKPA